MAEEWSRFEAAGKQWEWFRDGPGFRCEWGECARNADACCQEVDGETVIGLCAEHLKEWSGGQIDLAGE